MTVRRGSRCTIPPPVSRARHPPPPCLLYNASMHLFQTTMETDTMNRPFRSDPSLTLSEWFCMFRVVCLLIIRHQCDHSVALIPCDLLIIQCKELLTLVLQFTLLFNVNVECWLMEIVFPQKINTFLPVINFSLSYFLFYLPLLIEMALDS